MNMMKISDTDIAVSRIGLGTVKFGRNQQINYPEKFSLPSDKEILNLLSVAKDLGIKLLDTAPAYGISEERLGKLLRNHRHDWIIASKVGENFVDGSSSFDFSEQAVYASAERSLQRLHTDYLDILLVHSNGEDKKIIEEHEIFNVLQDLKQQGKIRSFGMSTKTVEGGKMTVDHADVAMVTHNPIYTDERDVISYAYKKKKSIFIKKAFASGHLQKISGDDPVQAALDFIFQTEGVTSVITGTLNPKHLQETVTKANKAIKEFSL